MVSGHHLEISVGASLQESVPPLCWQYPPSHGGFKRTLVKWTAPYLAFVDTPNFSWETRSSLLTNLAPWKPRNGFCLYFPQSSLKFFFHVSGQKYTSSVCLSSQEEVGNSRRSEEKFLDSFFKNGSILFSIFQQHSSPVSGGGLMWIAPLECWGVHVGCPLGMRKGPAAKACCEGTPAPCASQKGITKISAETKSRGVPKTEGCVQFYF